MGWFVLRRWRAHDLPKERVVVVGKDFRVGRMVDIGNHMMFFLVFVSCEENCSEGKSIWTAAP